MIVHENITKTVAFAAVHTKKRKHKIGGTVFFVTHPIEGTAEFKAYIVTAAHVVEAAEQHAVDQKIHLRVHRKGDRPKWIATPIADWVRHADSRIDVAVLPLDWGDSEFLDIYDQLPLGSDLFLTAQHLETLGIRPGDELYFPGLFISHEGKNSNVPIIRTGTIAAMPDDPVCSKRGDVPAYLAETRSTGGHSGSPVFVHFNDERLRRLLGTRQPKTDETLEKARQLVLHNTGLALHPLLGLVHGHFGFTPSQIFAMDDSTDGDDENDSSDLSQSDLKSINSGIAVITPATAILEVLNQPGLVEQRRQEGSRGIDSGEGEQWTVEED